MAGNTRGQARCITGSWIPFAALVGNEPVRRIPEKRKTHQLDGFWFRSFQFSHFLFSLSTRFLDSMSERQERWGFPQRLWPLLWAQMRRAVAPGGAAALPMRRIAGVEAVPKSDDLGSPLTATWLICQVSLGVFVLGDAAKW